jgi:hypothetical protein
MLITAEDLLVLESAILSQRRCLLSLALPIMSGRFNETFSLIHPQACNSLAHAAWLLLHESHLASPGLPQGLESMFPQTSSRYSPLAGCHSICAEWGSASIFGKFRDERFRLKPSNLIETIQNESL